MVGSKTKFNEAVARAVAEGLSLAGKKLPSWLFYDEKGDRLFQQIMRMPEYYPTRCEYDILQHYKEDLMRRFSDKDRPFHLIELGAGDGLKTEILLDHFIGGQIPFTYVPIDISANVLEVLSARICSRFPDLQVRPLNKSYDEALVSLRDIGEKKVILFMGANIGNFSIPEATQFLKKITMHLAPRDLLLIGFDLKKDPRIIQEAYDDPHGLTRRFNLNILERLNREVGADFKPDNFSHYPYYEPATGTTKSFLISMKDQSVRIEALGRSFHFDIWESIQTEVSQKYDMPMIEELTALAGLQIVDVFFDNRRYFCDVLLAPA